jgi:hypothetical protein
LGRLDECHHDAGLGLAGGAVHHCAINGGVEGKGEAKQGEKCGEEILVAGEV